MMAIKILPSFLRSCHYFFLSFSLSIYISLTKATLTSPLLSATNLQQIVTIIEGRIELITFVCYPTYFSKYLWLFTFVYLEIKEWGYDARHGKGKVVLWVDTGDIYFFMV
jgi:hypothetical protein